MRNPCLLLSRLVEMLEESYLWRFAAWFCWQCCGKEMLPVLEQHRSSVGGLFVVFESQLSEVMRCVTMQASGGKEGNAIR
jgi:hypothetical protein